MTKDIFILMKYIDNEYLDYFKNGNIYLTPLQTFREMEDKSSESKISDKYEAHIFRRYSSDEILKLDVKEVDNPKNSYSLEKKLSNGDNGFAIESRITSKETSKWGICCFTALKVSDKEVFNETVKYTNPYNHIIPMKDDLPITLKKIETWTIRKEYFKKIFREVGGPDRTQLLINPLFIKKLIKYNDQNFDFPVACNYVKYFSKNDKSNVDTSKSNYDQLTQSAFTKRDDYKDQKEFRVVLFDDTDKINRCIHLDNMDECIINSYSKGHRFSISRETILEFYKPFSIILNLKCKNSINKSLIHNNFN